MLERNEVIEQVISQKLVAVIRGNSITEAVSIIEGAIQGGMKLIELTYTTPFVQDVFQQLRNEKAIIGAGTVLDSETARHAILNGAKFIVSPQFDCEIAKLCNLYRIAYFPGCMTITECVEALKYGCEILKLFPANQFSPSFIKTVKGPLPNVQIMPTGGINLLNLKEWVEAGAVAVGIGGDLNKAFANSGSQGVIEVVNKYFEQLKGGMVI